MPAGNPAWGYNPLYSTYAFDEPVYGYQDLPPDKVIANVQGALQDLGYYLDEIDGVLGPTTRAALERYQQGNGLPVTGLIGRKHCSRWASSNNQLKIDRFVVCAGLLRSTLPRDGQDAIRPKSSRQAF